MYSNSQVHVHMREREHTHTYTHTHTQHALTHTHTEARFPTCVWAIGGSREATDSQGKVLMVSNILLNFSKAGTGGSVCVCVCVCVCIYVCGKERERKSVCAQDTHTEALLYNCNSECFTTSKDNLWYLSFIMFIENVFHKGFIVTEVKVNEQLRLEDSQMSKI